MTIQLKQLVEIPVDGVHIEGVLELPANAIGIVLFAHGSGSSRRSPRNNFVARVLREHGIGTLLMDLLTLAEDLDYQTRFDIPLLTRRLMDTTRWVRAIPTTGDLPVGYFGASTGAAAALQAAAALRQDIRAVVSRGGRPDLAGKRDLSKVTAPTLLLRGAESDLLTQDTARAMAERGPRAQCVEFAGVGHAPTLVAADQIAAVRDFLAAA